MGGEGSRQSREDARALGYTRLQREAKVMAYNCASPHRGGGTGGMILRAGAVSLAARGK